MGFDKSINQRMKEMDAAIEALKEATDSLDIAAIDAAQGEIKMSAWIHASAICFHCGHRIEHDVRPFHWQGHSDENGHNGKLTMHPACLLDWVPRLTHDIENAKRLLRGEDLVPYDPSSKAR